MAVLESVAKGIAILGAVVVAVGAAGKYFKSGEGIAEIGQGVESVGRGVGRGLSEALSVQVKPSFSPEIAPKIGITGLQGEDPLCGTRDLLAQLFGVPGIACKPGSTNTSGGNDRIGSRPQPPVDDNPYPIQSFLREDKTALVYPGLQEAGAGLEIRIPQTAIVQARKDCPTCNTSELFTRAAGRPITDAMVTGGQVAVY